MTERYPDHAVTRANVAIIKTEDNRIAAGVEMCKRTKAEDGRIRHEPYAVMSWIRDDLRTPSLRQALPVVLTDALSVVDAESKIVIFRSFARSFMRNIGIAEQVGLIATERGLIVKVSYVPQLVGITPNHPMMLAEDAIRRGYTLSAQV